MRVEHNMDSYTVDKYLTIMIQDTVNLIIFYLFYFKNNIKILVLV